MDGVEGNVRRLGARHVRQTPLIETESPMADILGDPAGGDRQADGFALPLDSGILSQRFR